MDLTRRNSLKHLALYGASVLLPPALWHESAPSNRGRAKRPQSNPNPWTAPITDWHIAGFLAAKTLLLAIPILLHAWWDLKGRHHHPNWDCLPS